MHGKHASFWDLPCHTGLGPRVQLVPGSTIRPRRGLDEGKTVTIQDRTGDLSRSHGCEANVITNYTMVTQVMSTVTNIMYIT